MFCFVRSKNSKLQKRGKVNLIGRLQLSTERSKEEDNEGIIQLRVLRVQVGGGRDGTGRDGTGRDGTGRDGTGRDGIPCDMETFCDKTCLPEIL